MSSPSSTSSSAPSLTGALSPKDARCGDAGAAPKPSPTLTKPNVWLCLSLALFLLWYDTAFRTSAGTLVTLPIALLNHPRGDLDWLSALLSMCITALVSLGLAHRAAPAILGAQMATVIKTTPACAKLDIPTFVAAFLCAFGTAVTQVGKRDPELAVVGGLVAGGSFAVLAIRSARLAPIDSQPRSILTIGLVGLGVSSLLKLVLFSLNIVALETVVCLVPVTAAACVWRARAVQSNTGAPQNIVRPEIQPKRMRAHVVETGVCFLGLGLYMGIIGFASDGLERSEYLSQQLLTSVVGTLIAFALLAAAAHTNPDGPYVLLPVTVGTAAFVFLLTAAAFPSDAGSLIAHVAGRTTDSMASTVAVCTMLELAQSESSESTGKSRRPLSPAIIVAACSATLLVGIILGGVFMSTVGLGISSIALVTVSLLYGAMLCLGLLAQQKSRSQFVIVRNPVDAALIAEAQAKALAKDAGTLTPREEEILPLLLQHQSVVNIADNLGISRNTVKTHIAHIYEKFGVNTRNQLIGLAATKTLKL